MAKFANADGRGQGLIAIDATITTALPVASGADSIVIGGDATASGQSAIAIGNKTSLGVTNSTAISTMAIGANTIADHTYAIAIGSGDASNNGASSQSYGAIVIGAAATANNGYATQQGGVAIGFSSHGNGISAVAVGAYATAPGTHSIAVGGNSSGNGQETVVIGYSANSYYDNVVVIGNVASTSISKSIAIGYQASASRSGQIAFATGYNTASEDAQAWIQLLRATTTDATVTELLAGGVASAYLTLADNHVYYMDVHIIGRRTDVVGDTAIFTLTFGVSRGTGVASVVLLGTPVITTIQRTDATWAVSVNADTTNGRVAIKVNGAAAKTVRWMANARVTEVA